MYALEVKMVQGEVLDHRDLSVQSEKGINWLGKDPSEAHKNLGCWLVILKKHLVHPKPEII